MPTFRYSTPAQLRQRVRQEFKNATGRRLHKIAAWADANLTDVQLQNVFGITAPQAVTLRTKLQAMAARLNAFDTEAGQ